jgi:hypothetical protein
LSTLSRTSSAPCDATLGKLQAAGDELCETEIPKPDLMRNAHAVTIRSEMASAMQPHVTHPDIVENR